MRMYRTLAIAVIGLALDADAYGQPPLVGIAEERGTNVADRMTNLDGNNVRTRVWNFGMGGDFPVNPLGVDLSQFHSLEFPQGSGMNYSDGLTPFILAKVRLETGSWEYIMETGYRERQEQSPYYNRIMRFEPRPGFFQSDTNINTTKSFAVSNRPATWPPIWPDKMSDSSDPGWAGSWNGFFGKNVFRANQESYFVIDDNYYDKWRSVFHADSMDTTRYGLGLRLGVRSFQWLEPSLSNTMFWHYDILNEGTTDYDSLLVGVYIDAAIGSAMVSCDGVSETDDDLATWERLPNSNLGYMWDYYGHGVDLVSNCSPTSYAGFTFLETPGNPANSTDDDLDGITDESQSSGPGTLINGQTNIQNYVALHYNLTDFAVAFGDLTQRPAFSAARWWTGDEDLDWVRETDDVGEDGIPGTSDPGEGDGVPTRGEPHFEIKDIDESDMLGLTGFQMNYITNGIDDVVFFMHPPRYWPRRLYSIWTNPDFASHFDTRIGSPGINIGYLLASGPFQLRAGQTAKFRFALTYGGSLANLQANAGYARAFFGSDYTEIPPLSFEQTNVALPQAPRLLGAYPNPFNPTATIRYELPQTMFVSLCVFDVLGRNVSTLVDERRPPGSHTVRWNATNFASGVYFYQLKAGDYVETKRFILMK